MIDFNKQPHCRTCCHRIGNGDDLRCAESVEYKEDGSCKWEAEKLEQCRWDALTDYDIEED